MDKQSSSKDNSKKKNNTTDTMKKKQALVTITPYNEQEKRVLNIQASTTTTTTTTTLTTTSTTTTTMTTGSSVSPPAPPPLPLPSKNRGNDDTVEMQSIESFKLKEAPSTVPKPPSTYFPVTSPSLSGSPRHSALAKATGGKDAPTSPVTELAKTSPSSASPTNVAQSAKANTKVAIRIGAYEGETKQPSRLEFLPQQTNRDKSGAADETANGPVVSRLQNELAATLQRSNLRRKTEGENSSPVKSILENATSSNDTTNTEFIKIPQGNVEKLASALSNKVTIKVNPDNSSR